MRNYAVAIAPWQFQNIAWKIDNACFRKIFGQPTNLDVPDLADNNWEVTSRDEPFQLFMRVPNERTRSIDNVESVLAPRCAFPIRRAMRSDHHARRCEIGSHLTA